MPRPSPARYRVPATPLRRLRCQPLHHLLDNLRHTNKAAARVLLTLHGGSGTDDDDLRKAIAARINIVHINTELRVARRRGLEDRLAKHPDEIVPYRILPAVLDTMMGVTSSRLKLFSEGAKLALPG